VFLFHVKRSAFYPQPNVDSAVVRITPHATLPDIHADHFFALAKAGFSQPRKQLRNTLSTGLNLTREQSAELLLRAHIEPSRRPETLSINEWSHLTKIYENLFSPGT
jgi:16S rRNA (adenine1518-N6/adenine1519-N6)-dimethyltransferase